MEYRKGYSALGFGLMRLPSKYEECEALVLRSLELGVNYFDTAYIYPGNEKLLGKILEKNDCRDKMQIASKIPHYLIKTLDDLKKIFRTQLERMHTDYIDNYLMHMLPDLATWERLKKLGVLEWLEEQKRLGTIRNIGFSYHGGTPDFLELLEAYDWDFVQVQYNYIDEHSQAGRAGVERAYELDIPVIIMEPLRGGLLATNLPGDAAKMVKAHPSSRSAAAWSLRWLWNQRSVTCVLSGMKDLAMLEENVSLAEDCAAECMTSSEADFVSDLRDTINANIKVGCTGCGYCMPCPFGVNIPTAFRIYNASYLDSYQKAFKEYMLNTSFTLDGSYASLCKSCGKCKVHCPQSIDIPQQLKSVKRRFENPVFKGARWFIRHFMLKKK